MFHTTKLHKILLFRGLYPRYEVKIESRYPKSTLGAIIALLRYYSISPQIPQFMGQSNILSINRPQRHQFSNTRLFKRRNSQARILAFEELLVYKNTTVPVIGEKSIDLLTLPSILFVQAFGEKSIFYCACGKKVWSAENIQYWMDKIDPKYFVQTHPSYYVNVRLIKGIDWQNNQLLVEKIAVPMTEAFHVPVNRMINE